ncbi:hypothetical protein AVEN_119294-1 [Araneus ventricosus]|uniref:Uncharacterized protein n=1 Tax=Araneus ventricosus TaxID=182803 RepID=A0A4Y2EHV5_ARAVE|nr:hypothetical protein AVEN_119294-1 [Araneus ventricosus]
MKKNTSKWRNKVQAITIKTFKDWKCYVRKKAGRITLHQKQTGGGPPSKEALTVNEEKLLAAIGQVAAHGQKSVAESPICGDVENETNDRVQVAERKVTLLQQQVALLERRALAAERKATAEEQLVLLKEKKCTSNVGTKSMHYG